jgi:DNA-binding PadR family transcriptional regulator
MSGYDIKKAVEESISNFWHESYGQIYPILKQLTADGLVTQSTSRGAGGRARHVYAITPKGRLVLQQWLAEPADPGVVRIELLLKLFFGRQVDPQINIRHLEAFRERQRHFLDQYSGIARRLQTHFSTHPDLPYWLITLRYGQRERQALLAWCEDTLAEFRRTAKARTEKKPKQRRPRHTR